MMKKKTENEENHQMMMKYKTINTAPENKVLALKQTFYRFHKITYFCIFHGRAISSQTSFQFIKCNCTTIISIHCRKHFSQTSNLLLRKAFSNYLIAQNKDIDSVFKRGMLKVNIKHQYVFQINRELIKSIMCN
jgi:hypothetical protein